MLYVSVHSDDVCLYVIFPLILYINISYFVLFLLSVGKSMHYEWYNAYNRKWDRREKEKKRIFLVVVTVFFYLQITIQRFRALDNASRGKNAKQSS